jgi:hypothetical protein
MDAVHSLTPLPTNSISVIARLMKPGLAAIVLLLLCASSISSRALTVEADGAPYCAPDRPLDWQPVLAPLSQQLGDAIGQPLECAHPAGDSDDTIQQTTTGLAIVRATTGAPTFTDGTTRWALIGSNLVTWTDSR